MRVYPIFSRASLLLLIALAAPVTMPAQFQTHLSSQTDRAFEEYLKMIEQQLDWSPRVASGKKPGEIVIVPAHGRGSMDVHAGMIHDWTASLTVPGSTVEKTLALLQDYANYKTVYSPNVAESKLLHRDGNRFQAYLRMVKKQAVTVVLNGEFGVEYRPLDNGRWAVVSRSTRISEMDGERELPPGSGHGFLWRLNAYWVLEPRPEGVYIECRSVSLSRDIPALLSLIVKPFVTTVPKQSLRETMEATLRALR